MEIMEHVVNVICSMILAVWGFIRRDDVEAMESLKRRREELRGKVMDIEDEVNKEEMPCKKKMKTEVKNWLREAKDLEPECDDLEEKVSNSWLPLFGDPVGKMQCRVNQLIKQTNNFNGLVLDDVENDGVPCLPTKLYGNKITKTLEEIMPCLEVGNTSSIGIYGMGGVGKTTLAKHIKFQLEQKNYRVYWVTVSQESSITGLQDKIANVLGITLSNRDEKDRRANILRAAFQKMEKSVFILDDVWKEFNLQDVGIAVAANKCRLIWTTRSSQVCARMSCQKSFKVITLDERESWDLFSHTFGHETELSEEVEKIAKSVTNRCAGLPLGIVTTASSMRGVTEIHEWKIVLEQLKSSSDGHQEMEDEVFPILECSFNRLRDCERPCFLYCCLYPEDHEIEREELIDLFIYAELIQTRHTMELQRSDGHRILNKLVKVCLLEEAKNRRGSECVRMHDLIRDMALRITSRRYNSKNTQSLPRFLVKSNVKKSSNHLRVEMEELEDDLTAVSLRANFFDDSDNILEISSLMLPNSLSTLIIDGVNIREIPDSFLQHMYGLKVLNLGWCRGLRLLPNCISDMVSLTALLLEGCSCLESVPPLGKLKKLRTLNLIGTKVDDVPQGLEELVNLERLYMGFMGGDADITMVRLNYEREFARSRVRARARARARATFSKLNRLRHLVLPATAVHISDLLVLNELKLYVGGLTYDQFSKSRWWPTHYKMHIFDVDPNDYEIHLPWKFSDSSLGNNVVADCWRHRWVNQLMFERCNFQEGLDVVLPPENLPSLELYRCSGFSDIFFHRWIDRSKHLYHLVLNELEELKFVLNLSSPDDDEGVASNLEGALRNLRFIELQHLPNLIGLINMGRVSVGSLIPPGTFCSLQKLFIKKCHGLRKLFSVRLVQQCLQNLNYLFVLECDKMEEIVGDNDDHDLHGGVGIIFQPSSSGPSAPTSQALLLPKLQSLCLSCLPKLENVCCPTIMIGSDEPTKFSVNRCPKLKRLPSFSSTEITYEISGRQEWWNSLEWNNPSDKDAVLPFFEVSQNRMTRM